MKRKIGLILLVLIIAAALGACQAQKPIEGLEVAQVGQTLFQAPTQPPSLPTPTIVVPETDWNEMPNPGSEEGVDVPEELRLPEEDAESHLYAGATPMPLDPIDKPTPTPRPKLTFAYQKVEKPGLGITFEAPIGWAEDDSVDSTVILTQPDHEVLDNYRAFLSIEVRSSGSTLSTNDMKSNLAGILETLGGQYESWSVKVAAPRTLIGSPGVYNDYRGVLPDGTIVRGRVHVATVDKKTVTVHLSCPGGFNEDYTGGVFAKLRSTLKMIK